MLQLMRKHHKVAMLVIAIVVIISFTVWTPGSGNDHSFDGYQREIAGKRYDSTDLDGARAIYQMAQMSTSFSDAPGKLFGLFMRAQGQTRTSNEEGRQIESILYNLITIREAASKLSISVEDEEVKKAVQALTRFQTDGKFDRGKFDALFGDGPNAAASQRHFFTMMKHALLLDKMQTLIAAPMQATDYDVNIQYNKANVKTTVQTVVLPRKEHEAVKATDEDAKKFYDANSDKKTPEELDPLLRSEATRDFKYIKVEKVKRDDVSKLPAAEIETKKKEWDAQDKKVGLTASIISNGLIDETKPLSLADAVLLVKDKPEYLPVEIKSAEKVSASNVPEDLKGDELMLEEMIDRGKGVVRMGNAYVIFEGTDLVAPRLLTFDEAKAKLLEKLTKDKIAAALQDKANGVRSKLQEALTAGKPFAEALTAAGVTATSYTYSQKSPAKDAPEYFPAIQAAVASLNPGALAANPVEAKDDLAIVYLEKTELMADPKMADDKKTMKRTEGYTDSPFSPSPLFLNWFNQQRAQLEPVFGEAQ